MIKEVLPRYDFDTRQDGVNEEGDVTPLEAEEQFKPYFDTPNDEVVDAHGELPVTIEYRGVSVSLAERAMALRALGVMYAGSARASGMRQAATMPASRRDLEARYSNVDGVVSDTLDKADRGMRDEAYYLGLLTKSRELVEAGFDPEDVALDEQVIRLQVRRAIGATAGAAARNKALRGVYTPR